MLLACIRNYLKLFLRYTFLILDTYNPETLYLPQQEWEDLFLIIEAKTIRKQKRLSNTTLRCSWS